MLLTATGGVANGVNATGLANRRLFARRLEAALARRGGVQELGVLFLDLDGFKVVNDTYGHDTGDEVLLTAAHRLGAVAEPQEPHLVATC